MFAWYKGEKMMRKKKGFISLLTALVFCALICAAMPSLALAASGQTDIWYWTELSDGTLSVTGCTYATTAVVSLTLPESLDTKFVTRIENGAFYTYGGLTGITLPDGLKSIGDRAFYGCSKLTGITLPDSLESIGNEAFGGAGLTSITIPGSVTSVGPWAFSPCYDLETVVMLDNLTGTTTIGSGAFASCSSLSDVTLPNGLDSIGDQMFRYCAALTSLTIPDGVQSIGSVVFEGSGLNGIVIPDSVTSIGASAFQNCPDLESVTLPANAGFTSIPLCAFYGCGALNSITIPSNVTSIGSSAFFETGFTTIAIPDSITSIEGNAFQNCPNLASVTLPGNDGFTSIPANIFSGCQSLASIVIPSHVTTIDGGAFGNCPSLTNIGVNPANTHFSSQDGVLYNTDKSTLVCYPGVSGAFSIPDSVTAISEEAFSECNNLTEVTIPDSVTSIGDGAFCECENLSIAIIYSDSAVFGDYVFEDTAMPIYTATSDDGIFGHAGSTAQDYAQVQGILFHIIAGPASTYALTITAGTGGGITTGSSGNYAQGAVINIAAAASANYSFNNWTSTGGGTFTDANSASTTFTMPAGAATITANFTYNGGSSGGGGGGGSTTSLQSVSSASGSAAVDPAAGGAVSIGSDVTLNIPANALQGSDSAQVGIQRVDATAASSGFMLLGTVYQCTVNGQDHYSFNLPVTLTFTFDPSKLAPGETPAVHYYDEEEGRWVNLGGTVSGNTITVTVDHFTKFAVLAEKAAGQPVQPPVQKPAVVLADLSGHWAEKNIEKLIEMGAVSGYPDSTFKPDAGITRAEFTAMLVKAFRLQGQGDKIFADTAGHWAREFIATAASCGIIGGYDPNTFGPGDPVTREQMAVMTVKAAKISQATGELAFTDREKISPWARESVNTAVKAGIITGYSDNTFRPSGEATRAEAVTMIAKALN